MLDTPPNPLPPDADAVGVSADAGPSTAPAVDAGDAPAAPCDADAVVGAAADSAADAAADSPADAAALPAAPTIPELSPAACAARLAELFPAVFTPQQPKPLKLRIQADLQQRAPGVFTRKVLSAFLHRHTTSTAYLKSLAQAPHRFDLDGVPAGEVAAEHRDAALAELQRRRSLFEERRAAEREAQRAAERNAHQEARRAQLAQDEERRELLALLRAFESSTLTKPNFCALKSISETDLDARLALARQLPPPAPRPEFDAPRRTGPDRPAGRPGERTPRRHDAQQRDRAQAPRKRP